MLVLVRDIQTEKAFLGRLFLGGVFVCYTLENASKVIPCGSYTIENSNSPKFERELPLIYNKQVPAKRGIRIHLGNTVDDSAGCILVGMKRNEKKQTLQEAANAEYMVTMICRNTKKIGIINDF